MRSLTLKLTLAFLFVGLIGAVLITVIIRQRTQSEFDRFMQSRDLTTIANSLGAYYQINGSWEGIDQIFRPRMNPPSQMFRGNMRTPYPNFVLVSSDRIILFGGSPENIGKRVSSNDTSNGAAIELSGIIVGWVIPAVVTDFNSRETPEGLFLANINQTILFSAIAAAFVALVLGGFLAYSLTRDLRSLTEATKKVAQGELGYQVNIRAKDELGELADSFNQMSADLAHSTALRQQMTANIAHDLRSPLSVILGYTEALNDGKLAPSPEIYTVMHTEASHLNRLIDDLKTISLADAGELPLYLQRVPPASLLHRVANAFRVQADRKGISLQVEVEPDLPEIEVDVERMIQVLGNLMSNALRHTSQGGEIRLSANSNANGVRLLVADNGEGIPADDLPFIFERSYRGDRSRQQKDNETGLGLAIAKSLVEAQAGSISVTSQLRAGTAFSIQLKGS
jgi:two-component system sensor histidine kinase BaeS